MMVLTSPPTHPSSTEHPQQHQQILPSQHQDYILATALDVYGRRLATCSGDRTVRVFDLSDAGQWCLAAAWQAHRGAVTAVAWAHPEFGSLLATAGTDHDVKIWEELQTTTGTTTQPQQMHTAAAAAVAGPPRPRSRKPAVASPALSSRRGTGASNSRRAVRTAASACTRPWT